MTEFDIYNVQINMEVNMIYKRQKANDIMVEVMKLHLPDDVLRYTSHFLFYDISSNAYYEHNQRIYYRQVMQYIVHKIPTCFFSRYHCYFFAGWCVILNEEDDAKKKTIHSHNCLHCGNYFLESLYPRDPRILCQCPEIGLSIEFE